MPLLGAESAIIVCRRTEEQLPARAEEVRHAVEEGVRFAFLTAPTEVVGNEKRWVAGLKCLRMQLGDPDESVPMANLVFEVFHKLLQPPPAAALSCW